MPAGVLLWSVEDDRIVFANEQAHLLTGGLADGPRPPAGRYTLDGAPLAEEDWPTSRALATGGTVREQLVWQRPDGFGVTLLVTAAPVRGRDGKVASVVVTLQDLTEAERRSAAEREFVANAAHELRTPLTALTSAVEVLQAGAKETPASRDLFLGHVEREVDRLRRLAHSLLVLVRAQAQIETPRFEIVAAEPLLRSLAEGIEPGPGVTFEVRCKPGLALLANAALIEQALGAMLSNAVRHTRAGRIVLAADKRDGQLELSVTDTGEGFGSETAENAFKRFYRGTGGGGGFGLGLAIARDAVEACGGTLTLDSEEGRGTRAAIVLPAATLVEA